MLIAGDEQRRNDGTASPGQEILSEERPTSVYPMMAAAMRACWTAWLLLKAPCCCGCPMAQSHWMRNLTTSMWPLRAACTTAH